jgi:hypothetical protein
VRNAELKKCSNIGSILVCSPKTGPGGMRVSEGF